MIKISNPITHEELLEVLEYNSDTGIFIWKETRPAVKYGDIAGSKDISGYIRIGLGGKRYLAHRLAWFYVNKEWPVKNIDHIDHNKSNNAIINLRDVSKSINQHNRNTNIIPMSGHAGIRQVGNKWNPRIMINGVRKSLGSFSNIEDAVDALNKVKDSI